MKKANITVSYDSEKLNALRLYLKQKDLTLETELAKAVDSLYNRVVPQGVREFVEMQVASRSICPATKPRKSTASAESDVHENATTEVTDNG
jgi:hypothetical protein